MKRKSLSLILLSIVCLAALAALLLPAPLVSAPLSPHQQVQAAWENALNYDGYRYSATVVQTTHPTLRLENAGLSSQQTRLYLEGEFSRPQEMARLKLWRGAGRVGETESALEVKIEDGRAYGRAAGATTWQDLTAHGGAAFTDVFAPGNDPLLYLSAARDIPDLAQRSDSGDAGGPTLGFTVDGLRFAGPCAIRCRRGGSARAGGRSAWRWIRRGSM